MKKIFLGLLAVVMCLSSFKVGAQENQMSEAERTTYISNNFAILEVKAVRLEGNKFVKQIRALDFRTKDNSVIAGFSIGDDMYIDNGKEYDGKDNDGIYTSIKTYEIESDLNEIVISNNNVYLGSDFKFLEDLKTLQSNSLAKGGVSVSIGCDLHSCSCKECGCLACKFGWGERLNWCFYMDNCKFEIKAEIGK